MKKLLYLITAICTVSLAGSCAKEQLDTYPAGQLGAGEVFSDSNKAQSAIDGIYRLMYTIGWSDSWYPENPGLTVFNMINSLRGEDHFMASQGQGWFYFDYAFNTSSDWTTTSGRQYATWNFFYTMISLANYVTDYEDMLKEDSTGRSVLGQAFAIRAYSYYCLYELFCQGNYSENKGMPGVPIYTEGTNKDTKGEGRGTIEGLFGQINADFKKSTDYFKESSDSQSHESHIDLYVAYGLWARALLAQQDYPQAGFCAEEALKKPGLTRVATIAELGGFNSVKVSDVMWGFEVVADQTGPYGPFVSHMDREGGYGAVAPQCFDYWIYEQGMSDTDLRRGWADFYDDGDWYFYWQKKFEYTNIATSVADIINMRAEEMLITLAECKCRAGEYTEARSLLAELYAKRYSEARDITALANSAAYNSNTYATPSTLMDEILLQRRIELWCEGTGRVPDLRRLNLGYTRSEDQPEAYTLEPNDPEFILYIPQKEFDSNPALDISRDQN